MKKIICLTLSLILVFVLASCGINKNIKPLKIKGEALAGSKEVEDWFNNFVTDCEQNEKTADFKEEQPYKLNAEIYSLMQKDEEFVEFGVQMSGKMISSPFAYKNKFKFTIDYTIKGKHKNESGKMVVMKGDITINFTYVEGVTYLKIKGSMSDTGEKININVLTTDDSTLDDYLEGFDVEMITSLFEEISLEESIEELVALYVSDAYSKFYTFKNGCSVSIQTDENDQLQIMQGIVKYDLKNLKVKSIEQYMHSKGESGGVAITMTVRTKIQTCLSANISKPNNAQDYYAY